MALLWLVNVCVVSCTAWKKGKGKGVAEWMRKEGAREKERIDLCVTKRERRRTTTLRTTLARARGREHASHEAEREEDTRGQLEQALFQTSPFLFSSASCRRCALFSTLSFASLSCMYIQGVQKSKRDIRLRYLKLICTNNTFRIISNNFQFHCNLYVKLVFFKLFFKLQLVF